MDFTTVKAVVAAVLAVVGAIIGLLVAFGVSVTPNQRDSIIAFVTVALPAVLGLIGWLHHGHVQVKRTTIAAQTPSSATPVQPVNVPPA